jgi:hypothetical protein
MSRITKLTFSYIGSLNTLLQPSRMEMFVKPNGTQAKLSTPKAFQLFMNYSQVAILEEPISANISFIALYKATCRNKE